MASYNKVIMVGNLTRDPQLSYLPSNTPVVEFGLASNRRWKSQEGEDREETCFVDCRAYGRAAEVMNQYLAKGRPVLIEGRLQFQQWTAQDGSKRSRHMIIVEQFQFMGSRRDEPGPAPSASAPERGGADAPPPKASDVVADDVPF